MGTIAQALWGRVFGAAMNVIAGCFARCETCATAADMIAGLLTEVDTRTCWTPAQELRHPGPHRLQHLLSRAKFDHDRALYLPKGWAADEERRETAGVPEEIMFATKSQQTATMAEKALELGVRARWFAGEEVHSGRELRWTLRRLGLGYAVGMSHTHVVTDGSGRGWKARQMINKVLPHQ
ncbi:transposase [Streptomyces antibioticus]|uniref:transposase n=1 Tax=Streptomyces antibioticus TaxID=1890 RepID=UPI00225582E1|nr:transposase [Streptomyces antibioticus]MCX5169745.1 transposase [Streptomyces antibioticus]